jgi:hypothetical protein
LNTEFAAIRVKECLKRLEQQIEDMLLSLDYKQLVKELDYDCKYSSQIRIEVVRIFCNIRSKEKQKDNKRLQKLPNRYAIEHGNMVVVKP